MIKSVGYDQWGREIYLIISEKFQRLTKETSKALLQALIFMLQRDRPWSVILLSSAHDRTVYQEFEKAMKNVSPNWLNQFLGFEIIYRDSRNSN